MSDIGPNVRQVSEQPAADVRHVAVPAPSLFVAIEASRRMEEQYRAAAVSIRSRKPASEREAVDEWALRAAVQLEQRYARAAATLEAIVDRDLELAMGLAGVEGGSLRRQDVVAGKRDSEIAALGAGASVEADRG